MRRNVKEPTVEHCVQIVTSIQVRPIREYFNWFLIKYGTGDLFVAENGRVGPMAHMNYYFWCQRYLEENNHEQNA